MPRCRKPIAPEIKALAAADYAAGVPTREISQRYGVHCTMPRVWYRAAQVQPVVASRASSLSGDCVVCGLPLEGHARCKACTILLGAGHWNPAGGAYCGYCETRRRR